MENAKAKAKEALKTFRKGKGSLPTHVKELMKRRKSLTDAIEKALEKGPKTVPEISTEINFPPAEVFWFVNAMRKYGQVEIAAEKESYLLYKLLKKTKQKSLEE